MLQNVLSCLVFRGVLSFKKKKKKINRHCVFTSEFHAIECPWTKNCKLGYSTPLVLLTSGRGSHSTGWQYNSSLTSITTNILLKYEPKTRAALQSVYEHLFNSTLKGYFDFHNFRLESLKYKAVRRRCSPGLFYRTWVSLQELSKTPTLHGSSPLGQWHAANVVPVRSLEL